VKLTLALIALVPFKALVTRWQKQQFACNNVWRSGVSMQSYH